MFKCLKCNKEFQYESEFIRHQNKKKDCSPNQDYQCKYCSKTYQYESKILEHRKTKKHIDNYNQNKLHNINKIYKNELEIEQLNIENKNKIKQLKNENEHLVNENNNYKIMIENLNKKNQKEINDLNNQNQLLKNENKQLKEENQNLINNKKLHSDLEFIYIIHCAQHLNTNIYKVGRTVDTDRRKKGYAKNSILLFSIPCINSKLMERKILDYLEENVEKYFKRTDLGNEYFQCNLQNLITDIYKMVLEN